MKNVVPRFIALLLMVVVFSGWSYGWSDSGHMTVAFVAYRNLTSQKRTRVDQLIRLNPRFHLWESMIPPNVSPQTRNGMLFMIAATWADQIKSDGQHVADGPNNGNSPPPDHSGAANLGYSDPAMHKYWHFIDTPFSTDGTPLIAAETPNAKTQIIAFRNVLKSDSPDELKSYDLVWLLHLVGDVHQPLHSAARFTHQLPQGDEGGNFVNICNPQCGIRLHSFWDGLLGADASPTTVIHIGLSLPPADPMLVPDLDVDHWVKESFFLAKTEVYKSPIGPGNGPFLINPVYRANALAVARQRVALAGARLARILNLELK